MTWSGYSTYLLLGMAYLAILQSVTACSCIKEHPQTHFCMTEFVAVVRIKEVLHVGEFEMAYKVKINRVFKSKPSTDLILRQNMLWTSSSDSLCGVTDLMVGETYVISGVTVNGKARITICNLLIPWVEVTNRQRKGFRMLYHRGCSCEIMYTQWWRKGAILESTGGKRCLWESTPGPERCQEKHGVCALTQGGCSWIPSVPYKNCIKEHKRRIMQERLREP